ncbi:MAG: hypothetical protein PHO32_01615 [Candidatus Cloacimonetes bacterium]|nr:hypothetical protein [Candidatus Cloacimonadota bacterium]
MILNALAFKVVVPDIEIADEYNPEDSDGSVPFVVYLILAPLVEQDIVTDWGEEYVPATGLNVGVAIVGKLIEYVAEAVELGV